ncbi:MAG: hypothetical protein JO283_13830 [Bradyrhizobium sp.]|nr:hypothetical protein [Bradyrhizobium sp.]
MKRTVAALVAVATIAGSLVALAPPARAGDSVAAGVAAGMLGGAIVGGAIASTRPVYGGPVYVEGGPPPYGCYWQRQRYWDGYGWVIHPVRVCY